MEDRELMQAAAKAAGIQLGFSPKGPLWDQSDISNHKLWNPLANDGDALRLAVRLKLDMTFGPDSAVEITNGKREDDLVYRWQNTDGDIYAATRRAIVLTAAQIGGDQN